MKKILFLMLLLAGNAQAQYIGALPPNYEVAVIYSQDSDKFKAFTTYFGSTHESGFGARFGISHYEGPQNLSTMETYYENSNGYAFNGAKSFTNTVSANSQFLQLTFVDVNEKYNFHGAIGVRALDYSTDTSNTTSAQAKALNDFILANGSPDPALSYAKNVDSKLGANDGSLNGSRNVLIADAELRFQFTDKINGGVSFSTDIVESLRSIQTGTTYTYVGADADFVLVENVNFNINVGDIYFSDGNNRPLVRSKLSWTFLPEYGISTYLRTKNQTDSNPGSSNYYSPETLAQQAIGLQIRRLLNGLVYSAGAEYGEEQVNVFSRASQSSSRSSTPIYAWRMGVQTNPVKNAGITYGASLTGSNTSAINGGDQDYRWYGLYSWLKIPF